MRRNSIFWQKIIIETIFLKFFAQTRCFKFIKKNQSFARYIHIIFSILYQYHSFPALKNLGNFKTRNDTRHSMSVVVKPDSTS